MRSRQVEAVRRALRTAFIRFPEVFVQGARLVVGFSGGQDSTCLLHALANSHRELELLAVHVDHGLQPDSEAAAQRAYANADAMGVHCEVVRVEVARGGSLEEAARIARYQALSQAAKRHAARAVLVGHTADDQAETVLLNLSRGAALLGLAGMRMQETRGGATLVRPLLRVPRATTLAYCTHFGLSLVEDATNQSHAFTRNRVRLDLLPRLEQFNPAIRELLARTAELAGDDLVVLDALAAQVHTALLEQDGYDLQGFRTQPRALQRRVLRLALQSLGFGLRDVADSPIEDALNLLQTGQPNQTYHLPYGVEVCIKQQRFVLRKDGGAQQPVNTWDFAVPRV
jgi:tRNA(Ile)-lysidine synthase